MGDHRHSDAAAATATPARDDREIFRLAPTLDAPVLETIAARLAARGTDDGYVRLSQAYLPLLPISEAGRILALGCGTLLARSGLLPEAVVEGTVRIRVARDEQLHPLKSAARPARAGSHADRGPVRRSRVVAMVRAGCGTGARPVHGRVQVRCEYADRVSGILPRPGRWGRSGVLPDRFRY